MPVAKLTKSAIDKMRPADKDLYLRDTEIKGFLIKCAKTGLKTYIYEYKGPDRVTRRCTIGRHGIITPAEARNRAKELAGQKAARRDPAKEKTTAKARPTVKALADLWIADGIPNRRKRGHRGPAKPKTVSDYSGWLRRNILPVLGTMKCVDVEKKDIERVLKRLDETPTTANRVLSVLSSMFGYGIDKGWATANPCRGILRLEEKPKQKSLKKEDIKRLGKVLDDAETKNENQSGLDAIKLLLLTGARCGEIIKLRWGDVHFNSSELKLADTKTGAKTITLGSEALGLLREIHQRHLSHGKGEADDWVIPGSGPNHLAGLQKLWRKWRKRAGLDDCRIHDLRHNFASVLANDGAPLFIIAELLGHKSIVTTERYTHPDRDRIKKAADAVSNSITTNLGHG